MATGETFVADVDDIGSFDFWRTNGTRQRWTSGDEAARRLATDLNLQNLVY